MVASGYILTSRLPGEPAEFAHANLEERIKYCLRALLLTQAGERPAAPEAGSQLRSFLFRTLTPMLKTEMETHIRNVVDEQEKRIEVIEVEVKESATDKSCLGVQLKYRVKQTNKLDQCRLNLNP